MHPSKLLGLGKGIPSGETRIKKDPRKFSFGQELYSLDRSEVDLVRVPKKLRPPKGGTIDGIGRVILLLDGVQDRDVEQCN